MTSQTETRESETMYVYELYDDDDDTTLLGRIYMERTEETKKTTRTYSRAKDEVGIPKSALEFCRISKSALVTRSIFQKTTS
jgi:hypothetical protein